LFCFAFTAQARPRNLYKLGLSLAITGPTSDAGDPYSKGVEDYFKFVNDMKLLGDDKIDCTIRDDQYKTDVTKRNFEDFLDHGHRFLPQLLHRQHHGLEKRFRRGEDAHHPGILSCRQPEDSITSFCPSPPIPAQAIGLAEYVANNHKGRDTPKVAMFIHPSAFGRGPREDVQKAVAAGLAIEIVEVVEHGKDLDNTAMLQRLRAKAFNTSSARPSSPRLPPCSKMPAAWAVAKTFGEAGKITFLGCHYTGGNDLVSLAGPAAENFYWTTSYIVTSEPGVGTDAQLALAKKYGRDEKTANSHNYANGVMVAQVAAEDHLRAKAKGLKITKEISTRTAGHERHQCILPGDHRGSGDLLQTDKAGVDTLQLYAVKTVSSIVGAPFHPSTPAKSNNEAETHSGRLLTLLPCCGRCPKGGCSERGCNTITCRLPDTNDQDPTKLENCLMATQESQHLLEVNNIEVVYNDIIQVLRGVSLHVPRAASSPCWEPTAPARPPHCGPSAACSNRKTALSGWVYQIRRQRHHQCPGNPGGQAGRVMVPEGRRVFKHLTVDENIRVGSITRKDGSQKIRARQRQDVRSLPPAVQNHPPLAGYCSGGEQQMIAIARALMAAPKMLMLDEPSSAWHPCWSKRFSKTSRPSTGNWAHHSGGRAECQDRLTGVRLCLHHGVQEKSSWKARPKN
jgi:branched-chain amino acid transport system substrate-binding protein